MLGRPCATQPSVHYNRLAFGVGINKFELSCAFFPEIAKAVIDQGGRVYWKTREFILKSSRCLEKRIGNEMQRKLESNPRADQ